MQGRPTGVVAACKDINLGREIQELFASPNMRVNTTTDVTGTDGRTLACLAVAVVCVWVILACSPVNNLSAKRVLTCVGLRASCLDVRRHRCGPCVDVPLAGSVSVHVVLTVSNVWRSISPCSHVSLPTWCCWRLNQPSVQACQQWWRIQHLTHLLLQRYAAAGCV